MVYLTKVIIFLVLAAGFCLAYRMLSKRRNTRITEVQVGQEIK